MRCEAITGSGAQCSHPATKRDGDIAICGHHVQALARRRYAATIPTIRTYCESKHPDGWPCDRPPHEPSFHRNMVLGACWK